MKTWSAMRVQAIYRRYSSEFVLSVKQGLPLFGCIGALYYKTAFENENLRETARIQIEMELVRQGFSNNLKEVNDMVKIQILKRNLYHLGEFTEIFLWLFLDGISTQTKLPHDTYFWMGSAFMACCAVVTGYKGLRQANRHFRFQRIIKKCASDDCCQQMLSRSTISVNCRGYSRLSQTDMKAHHIKVPRLTWISPYATQFDQIRLRRQWLRYKQDLKVMALLSLAALGVGTSINVDHMNKSAKYSSDLLYKQWVCSNTVRHRQECFHSGYFRAWSYKYGATVVNSYRAESEQLQAHWFTSCCWLCRAENWRTNILGHSQHILELFTIRLVINFYLVKPLHQNLLGF